MDIKYNDLIEALSHFRSNDEGTLMTYNASEDFSGQFETVYQRAGDWELLPYLKFVVYGTERINIAEPLCVDFSEIDFSANNIELDRILNMISYYKTIGIMPKNMVGMRYSTNKSIQRIHRCYMDAVNVSSYDYGIKLDYSMVQSYGETIEVLMALLDITLTNVCDELNNTHGKTKPDGSNFTPNDFTMIYIIDHMPPTLAIEFMDKLKELGKRLYYSSPDLTEELDKVSAAKRLEEMRAIADKCYGVMLDDTLLDDYEDFANDYSKYDEVYDIVCNWVRAQDNENRLRFIVGEKMCRISGVPILLAWVTITTGVVFIFRDLMEIEYTRAMDAILTGEVLPAHLKFKMLTQQPIIRDRMLLGMTSLDYLKKSVDTLVAVKRIDKPVKAICGVPLDIILSEVKCVHEPGAPPYNGSPDYYGFYMDKPKFNTVDVIVEESNFQFAELPYDTVDILARDFEERISDVAMNVQGAIESVVEYYSPANYVKLLSQYLYAFETVFTHYMGYNKFYTINDIYIIDMQTETGIRQYACRLEFETRYTVQPIVMCAGQPVVDPEEIVVDNVYSPLFLSDFQFAVEENGYTYPEVNPMIQSAFMEALKTIRPVTSEDHLQLETASTKEATANIFDYLYPIVSVSTSAQTAYGVDIDSDLITELGKYFKELICEHQERASAGKLLNRGATTMETALTTYMDRQSIIDYAKDFITKGLSSSLSAIDRKYTLPKVFDDKNLSYRGLRFVHPFEAPINWTGRLLAFDKICPALCKRRR